MTELFAQSGVSAGFEQFLLLGLVNGSLYALIALGYTMVYGIIELINFAHGDLFMLGSFLALSLGGWVGVATAKGQDTTAIVSTVGLMLVAVPIACAAVNVSVDRVFYKPLRSSPKLTVIVTAIGVSFVFMNIGSLWKGSSPVDFPDLIPNKELISSLGVKFSWKDAMVIGITVPAMIA
ncbi:MAG: branched-chain amino acid ABC transporter permease [Gemmataceae bacterium]